MENPVRAILPVWVFHIRITSSLECLLCCGMNPVVIKGIFLWRSALRFNMYFLFLLIYCLSLKEQEIPLSTFWVLMACSKMGVSPGGQGGVQNERQEFAGDTPSGGSHTKGISQPRNFTALVIVLTAAIPPSLYLTSPIFAKCYQGSVQTSNP